MSEHGKFPMNLKQSILCPSIRLCRCRNTAWQAGRVTRKKSVRRSGCADVGTPLMAAGHACDQSVSVDQAVPMSEHPSVGSTTPTEICVRRSGCADVGTLGRRPTPRATPPVSVDQAVPMSEHAPCRAENVEQHGCPSIRLCRCRNTARDSRHLPRYGGVRRSGCADVGTHR